MEFRPLGRCRSAVGEELVLGSPENRLTQAKIDPAALTLRQLRSAGLVIFAPQFRKADGYCDGSINAADTTSPGGRPTLQGKGVDGQPFKIAESAQFKT